MILSTLQKTTVVQFADLIYRILNVRNSEKLGREQLEKLQRKRFESLLHHVFENSKFYNDLYRSNGITPEDIKHIKLEELPVINKQMLMDNYDFFVCDKELKKSELEKFISDSDNRKRKYNGRYQVIHTSGSTGHVGIFVYDMRSWNITKAMAITRISKAKLNPLKKIQLAFIGATDGHYAGISLSGDAPKIFYNFKSFSVNKPVHDILAEISEFQPTSLCGYASGVYLLAHEQLNGKLNIKPESVICSGDHLTTSMRSEIIEAFGVNPRNFYAASESLCMAAECDNHKGLHLFEDWHYYEIVNRKFEPVEAGRPGSLLLTTLHNFAQPLIRYQIHDNLMIDPEPCNCGRSTRRIKKISGRSEDYLWFKNPAGEDEFLHPAQIVEFFVPGLEKFQLKQMKNNHLHMRMIINGDAETVHARAVKRMQEILMDKNLSDYVSFSMEVVEEIPIDKKTGKFRQILPYTG